VSTQDKDVAKLLLVLRTWVFDDETDPTGVLAGRRGY
jgi:hypothetical protein